MTLDTILKNKMRARKISMLWKCCRCEAAPEALPLYFCKALDAENKATSGDWMFPKLSCGYTSCAICHRPKTKCSNSKCGHEKCNACPSHDGDINSRNSQMAFTIIGGERFAITFSMGHNCRWQCTESGFPNFNVLEGPEPSFWGLDCKDPEPTALKITRMIPLPGATTNQYLRSKERHIEDETNSQTELKDNSMADLQSPMSRFSSIPSDRAIQAAKTNSRPAKTSQEISSQGLESTDIGKNVNNSLDDLEDSGIKISGSNRKQIVSDFAIAELSGQTTRSDQYKCSKVHGSVFTPIANKSSSVPVLSTGLLSSYSSPQPTALVETESIISNAQSPQSPTVRTEDTSGRDPSMKSGATPVEEKSPPYYMSGIAGRALGLSHPRSTARPTKFVSLGKKFPSYSGSAKLKSTRPVSPLIRTPTRAPKHLRRKHRKHPDYNPPLTPPPDSPIPLPTPPPEDQQDRIVDRISERLPTPYGSSPDSPSSRWTPLFQESLPQSGTPNLSSPAVISRTRPASPVIRPSKIIYRQRKQ
ncbi:hypothetical protein BOTCAL_0189g00110 [Botryotinia calthae]|uniref:Uncharacterized protein n=1 Tax=Botryotinia calthae TaxID=38488 RepID=A0A4Y8D2F1_9HELO|nr:hypothetical protein BOTCAL_0189g00110 [Botryotinia calthae]